jgi:hypothetical protein
VDKVAESELGGSKGMGVGRGSKHGGNLAEKVLHAGPKGLHELLGACLLLGGKGCAWHGVLGALWGLS